MIRILFREVFMPIVLFVSAFFTLHYVPKEHLALAILGALVMMVCAYHRGLTYERYSPFKDL